MSKNWKLVRLGNYIQQIRGVSYIPSDLSSELHDKYVTLLRANNIQDTLIFEDVQYVHRSKVNEKQYIKKGDILICASSGSKHLVGKAAQASKDYDSCFGAFCKLIRPLQIDSSYLGNYFKSNSYRNEISKLSRGANINNIKNEHIDNLLIPYPPIEAQRHIAATLDKANELIALHKKQLEELDTLAESVFYELFGDPVKNEKGWKISIIEDLCIGKNDIKCGPFGTQLSKSEFAKSGVPLWGIPQINSNFTIPPNEFITDKKATELDSYSIMPADIVMSRKGNVGRCSLYPFNYPMGIMHSDVLRLRFDKQKVNPLFALFQFRISNYISEQIKLVSHGAIMAGINVGKLKKIKIFLPPLDLQTSFAIIIEKIEAQKALVRQALKESEDLFQRLMQDLFHPN